MSSDSSTALFQDSQVTQAGGHFRGGRAVHVVPLDAVAALGDGRQLGREHQVVDRLLLRREFVGRRERSG